MLAPRSYTASVSIMPSLPDVAEALILGLANMPTNACLADCSAVLSERADPECPSPTKERPTASDRCLVMGSGMLGRGRNAGPLYRQAVPRGCQRGVRSLRYAISPVGRDPMIGGRNVYGCWITKEFAGPVTAIWDDMLHAFADTSSIEAKD